MNIETIREMVDRYLQGTATGQEKRLIEKWLQARPEDNKSLDDQHKQVIHTSIWQSVSQHTNQESAAGKSYSLLNYRTWIGYAAMVTVLIGGAIWLSKAVFRKQPVLAQTITALRGAHKTATLPDSSIVHLFPGATLTIPTDFNTKERAITLTGKVFFEVKQDASRPFFVESGKLKALVLGTSFEVTAQDSLHTSVIVSTGKVGVQYNGRQLADLSPGHRLRYDVQQARYVIDEVNATMLCEWWNNGMVFNQSTLEEVAQSISAWYNVPVEIINAKWKQETVTIRIKDRSLPETLSLLSATLGFQYKTTNNRIIIY